MCNERAKEYINGVVGAHKLRKLAICPFFKTEFEAKTSSKFRASANEEENLYQVNNQTNERMQTKK